TLLALSLVQLHSPPRSALFPYTTLFRSRHAGQRGADAGSRAPGHVVPRPNALPVPAGPGQGPGPPAGGGRGQRPAAGIPVLAGRSEEHTSELQSRENVVCRLLLANNNAS